MRVNPNPLPDLMAALASTQEQQQIALLQLASGSRIQKSSDDPAAAATVVQIHDRTSAADSYLRSMSGLSGQLQVADSTLSSAVTALQRAITLGVQGGTGTLSDANRSALAEELSGIQEQLISLANVSYQGNFIFSGTAQVQPFAADASQPSGVRYDGNVGVNSVVVGSGFQLQANLPGSQIFAASGAHVFQSISDLIASLQSNSGIDTAVAQVRTAFDHVTSQRVFYGNAVNQITNQQTYLNNEKLQLSQQEDTVAGADAAAATSQVLNSENARSAALAAVGRISQLNLFDYLK